MTAEQARRDDLKTRALTAAVAFHAGRKQATGREVKMLAVLFFTWLTEES